MGNCKTAYSVIILVALGLIVLMVLTWHSYVKPPIYETAKMYNHYVVYPDSIHAELTITEDSVLLSDYLLHIDSICKVTIQKADNYISDVDLMISKSSAWMGLWLGIFAIVMTVPTIIQFVMTYKNEKRVEEMIRKHQAKMTCLEDKMLCSIKEHRISSIMMCLSSSPDPQLTPSLEKKRLFVRYFMRFLNSEFREYINLLDSYYESAEKNDDIDNSSDTSNMLLVITELKMALVRSQCVFSDITQNIHFQIVQNKLDEVFEKVKSGEWRGKKLTAGLTTVKEQFDIMLATINLS